MKNFKTCDDILFRFWNERDGVMLGKKYGRDFWNLGELFEGPAELSYADGNGYIPMQSLGIKDKNGKEIFEGDIVGFEGYTDLEVVPSVREFFMYIGYEDIIPSSTDSLGFWEVVGNVFENTDLIPQEYERKSMFTFRPDI